MKINTLFTYILQEGIFNLKEFWVQFNYFLEVAYSS